MNAEEAQKKINKAKIKLMMGANTTFFSALLANLKIILEDAHPSAATDGVNLWMNPKFIEPLSNEKMLGLMLHEVMHVAFEHMSICKEEDLDPTIHNIAADHYINLYITSLGYQIPDGGYCDRKYLRMSTMQIYNDLIKNPPNTTNYVPDVIPCPQGASEVNHKETVTSNIVKAVLQAQLAKDHKSIPGDILRRVKEALNPKLPWNMILMNYMDAYAKDDYTWSRPNRRYLPEFYLPSAYSESLKQITVGCDVSGSMSSEDINEIFAEVKYIWETMQPETLRLMTFDTQVHMNKKFNNGDSLDDITLIGGGGTNVTPLLDSIKKEEPDFALVFTDGYFGSPDMSGINTEIFWIIKGHPSFSAPIGTIILFD